MSSLQVQMAELLQAARELLLSGYPVDDGRQGSAYLIPGDRYGNLLTAVAIVIGEEMHICNPAPLFCHGICEKCRSIRFSRMNGGDE